TVTFFAILVLIGGGVQLVDAFHHRGWQLFGKLLVALLYFFVGATMLTDPLLASATLTLLIAWALLFIGFMRIIAAFQMKGMPGWVWTLIGGIAAIVLGIMIMNRWPVSGLWVIGMFVAIELIFNGWGMIMAALAVRNLASRSQ
ncbi:MAG TPA: HdeD family acid-resistance protein, partial [Gammaproteobacteria bacterium]|nr:HdeD family acid-resistance protein [Gammaproteobacteria bacterium]